VNVVIVKLVANATDCPVGASVSLDLKHPFQTLQEKISHYAKINIAMKNL
jgi:hypothetical protein